MGSAAAVGGVRGAEGRVPPPVLCGRPPSDHFAPASAWSKLTPALIASPGSEPADSTPRGAGRPTSFVGSACVWAPCVKCDAASRGAACPALRCSAARCAAVDGPSTPTAASPSQRAADARSAPPRCSWKKKPGLWSSARYGAPFCADRAAGRVEHSRGCASRSCGRAAQPRGERVGTAGGAHTAHTKAFAAEAAAAVTATAEPGPAAAAAEPEPATAAASFATATAAPPLCRASDQRRLRERLSAAAGKADWAGDGVLCAIDASKPAASSPSALCPR